MKILKFLPLLVLCLTGCGSGADEEAIPSEAAKRAESTFETGVGTSDAAPAAGSTSSEAQSDQ